MIYQSPSPDLESYLRMFAGQTVLHTSIQQEFHGESVLKAYPVRDRNYHREHLIRSAGNDEITMIVEGMDGKHFTVYFTNRDSISVGSDFEYDIYLNEKEAD